MMSKTVVTCVRWERAVGSETGRRTDHVMLRTLSPNQRSRFPPSSFISKMPTPQRQPPSPPSNIAAPTYLANTSASRPRPRKTVHRNHAPTNKEGTGYLTYLTLSQLFSVPYIFTPLVLDSTRCTFFIYTPTRAFSSTLIPTAVRHVAGLLSYYSLSIALWFYTYLPCWSWHSLDCLPKTI